mmetsp:Transcript_11466/g.26969  ORF Transcript_11466/g.26969 Transcript_11466/m.26969 type:complete len:147 (+) Transcript_11466:3-443(+)
MLSQLFSGINGNSKPVKDKATNIACLRRDLIGQSGGEPALKISQGDKNWRDAIQKQAKLEAEVAARDAKAKAELSARQFASAERAADERERAVRAERERVGGERRRHLTREMNTFGPRVAAQLLTAQTERKARELEKQRRIKELYG